MKFDQRAMVREAEGIERDATASLTAYIITGQADKYGEEMARARMLRSCAGINYKQGRREFCQLFNIDFERFNCKGLKG